LLEQRKPRSIRIAALLDKPERRLRPIHVNYVGFQIPDEFVVGYGLDYGEKYRNLDDICVLDGNA
jgi:hypoxanthine phosphoribosyltransferase